MRLPRPVPRRFLSVEDLAQLLRFRIKGLVHRRSQSRPSYTSLLLPGRISWPTSPMTLWAARTRARQALHRGVSAAALDCEFSLFFAYSDLVQLRLTDFDELLQSGWIRRLYSAGRGGRGVIMFTW